MSKAERGLRRKLRIFRYTGVCGYVSTTRFPVIGSISVLAYLHASHGAAPPAKMYAIKYTASEMLTVLSQLASPAINGLGAKPPAKIYAIK
jgi:hypothetical protein